MIDKLKQTYKRAEGIECVEVPDGYAIYDESGERIIFLNLTAAAVLELCDGKNGVARIAALIKDAYGLSADPKSEVDACLRSLLSVGVVEPCSTSRESGFFSFLRRLATKA